MKLIDKSAVVAEIEKLKEEIELQDYAAYTEAYIIGVKHTLETVSDILNTLEVKEVNLEEKATQLSQKYFPNEENIWARPNIEAQRCKSACIEMVEWFKAQKGE